MSPDEASKAQPLRELEWLVQFFRQHHREDVAAELHKELTALRRKAQHTLSVPDASHVLEFDQREKKHGADDQSV